MARVPRQPTPPLIVLLNVHALLAQLLAFVDWADLHSLLCSCSAARSIFRSADSRDIIFARFIPGYNFYHQEHDVYVSIHDLDLFLISLKFPVHSYPTCALKALSSPCPSDNARLAALALAYSRVVLLLQSLIHRSGLPMTPEPREHLTPLPILLRQLVFPPPLSYNPVPSNTRRLHSVFRSSLSIPAPPKAYSRNRNTSPDSTISRSSTPTSTPSSTPPPTSSPSFISAPSSSNSPHSFSLATSKARAPVLRAYVPCTELTDASNSVLLCEEQFLQSGLWSHLSTGDIVCNLGYVPSSSDLHFRQTWLIFNGSYLVPFTPGASPLPLHDPLSLPSPFYYSHILPTSPLANPVLLIPHMPLPLPSKDPLITLQLLATKVPSPPSPSGIAIARKYMWTAIIQRRRPDWDDEDEERACLRSESEMGEGWYGTWVLEAEGTREGRQVLLDWLRGAYTGPPREWELVRERCGVAKNESNGTVWLKLLHPRNEEEPSDILPS